MSNLVPVGRRAAKLAIKYGPQAKFLWDKMGKDAVEQARVRRAIAVDRRHAVEKARTLSDGWVLRQLDGERVVWVVFSGEQPITSYPADGVDLPTLLEGADLSKRLTPEEYDRRRARARAARAVRQARRTVRRDGQPPSLES